MKIAILGANGRLAHATAKAFLAAGHGVIAITRNGKCEGLTGDVELRAADVMKEPDVIAATEGADAIFNGVNPTYEKWEALCMPMARNVAAALKVHKAVHLFIGNVYNYGKEIPVNTNEATPRHRSTEKAIIREDMEALFREISQSHGIQTIILRAGDFYGTDKPGTWLDLVIGKDLKKGKVTWPGRTDIPHAFAYLPDLARAFVSLYERRESLPTVSEFHFAGHTLSGDEFMSILDKVTGKSLKRGKLNWSLIKMTGLVYPLMREVAKMNYLWFTPHSLDGSKLEAFLGGVHNTPVEEALAQAIYDQGLWDMAPVKRKMAA